MSENVEVVVVDASAILPAIFKDEAASAKADSLIEGAIHGRAQLIAPDLIDYEVATALKSGVLKKRIDEMQAIALLEGFGTLPIHKFAFAAVSPDLLSTAFRYGRSTYDAAYLVLARDLRFPLITGDLRLFNAVSAELPWVRWIGDYTGTPADRTEE